MLRGSIRPIWRKPGRNRRKPSLIEGLIHLFRYLFLWCYRRFAFKGTMCTGAYHYLCPILIEDRIGLLIPNALALFVLNGSPNALPLGGRTNFWNLSQASLVWTGRSKPSPSSWLPGQSQWISAPFFWRYDTLFPHCTRNRRHKLGPRSRTTAWCAAGGARPSAPGLPVHPVGFRGIHQ